MVYNKYNELIFNIKPNHKIRDTQLNEHDLFIFAQLLEYGIGGDINQKRAIYLYIKNYVWNKHAESLYRYALMVENGDHG